MLKVYIADDEDVVRQGLKKIIPWNDLGFEICGEANNGLQAYNDIRQLEPDLILLDIRMPKLEGLDLANQLREDGFLGRIIILSGYSEFKYAQEAIKCDVDSYLTKPVDEEELLKVVMNIRLMLQKKKLHTEHLSYYQEKAKYRILEEIIKEDRPSLASIDYTLGELNLKADLYQVLIIESNIPEVDCFSLFCDDLKIPIQSQYIEKLKIESYQVILLKGEFVIGRYLAFKSRQHLKVGHDYFVASGHSVTGINEIYFSYHEALAVYERRFFMSKNQSFVGGEDLPDSNHLTELLTANVSREIGKAIYEAIKIHQLKEATYTIDELKSMLYKSKNSSESIKSFLTGMYLFIIQEFKMNYASYDLKFLTNAEIIQKIHEYHFLEDILEFLEEEIERMIMTISNMSSEHIVDDILDYIRFHYDEDIKLKTLAPKFGYNSSYLGKIFAKKIGLGFNDYLHKTRTDKARELLLDQRYKVYEVSQMIGYKNVDYFHLKFKHFCGCTPNEYRIAHHIEPEED
jgi:two-component system, response regulator YesN